MESVTNAAGHKAVFVLIALAAIGANVLGFLRTRRACAQCGEKAYGFPKFCPKCGGKTSR